VSKPLSRRQGRRRGVEAAVEALRLLSRCQAAVEELRLLSKCRGRCRSVEAAVEL
jgi:hypothetical protein